MVPRTWCIKGPCKKQGPTLHSIHSQEAQYWSVDGRKTLGIRPEVVDRSARANVMWNISECQDFVMRLWEVLEKLLLKSLGRWENFIHYQWIKQCINRVTTIPKIKNWNCIFKGTSISAAHDYIIYIAITVTYNNMYILNPCMILWYNTTFQIHKYIT